MICNCEHAGDTNPSREQLAGILAAAREVQDPGCDVGVDGGYGEEAEERGLRCVVDEPARHEAVCEEEGEVCRSKTLDYC